MARSTTSIGVWLLLAFFVLAAASGCNKGPRSYPVSGTVRWEGQPVPKGKIRFVPKAGGRPGGGRIGKDGTYTVTSYKPGDGLLAGEYFVAIESYETTARQQEQTLKSIQDEIEMENKAPVSRARIKETWFVPEEYSDSDTSGLSVTIDSSSSKKPLDFDLPKSSS